MLGFLSKAQVSFTIIPYLNGGAFYEAVGPKPKEQAFEIQSLRFYISAIKFVNANQVVWEEDNSYHLMDLEQIEQFRLLLHPPKNMNFDAVEFLLGIDSATNVSGAMGGDLDPTKGMYWAWQSGYINFKIEGTSAAAASKDKSFALHLGGYLSPYLAVRKITFPLKKQDAIVLKMDVDQFLSSIDFTKTHHIMSPSADAVMLMRRAAQMFSIIENEN